VRSWTWNLVGDGGEAELVGAPVDWPPLQPPPASHMLSRSGLVAAAQGGSSATGVRAELAAQTTTWSRAARAG